ncbi:MAG: hypothetical protein IJ668_03175 [Selenomonadaceae bacterium]|nr:hypothetical protein [Selenomonadaceae bacterium]
MLKKEGTGALLAGRPPFFSVAYQILNADHNNFLEQREKGEPPALEAGARSFAVATQQFISHLNVVRAEYDFRTKRKGTGALLAGRPPFFSVTYQILNAARNNF